jgi:hypothetical protein
MIVNIRDPQTLRQINPASVSIYLQQNGWHEQQQVEGRVAFWTKKIEDNEEVEISLPLDSKLADFHLRISEILQNLAIVEHRLPEEIFNDLVNLTVQKTEASICISPEEIRSTYRISITTAFSIIIIIGLIILTIVFQIADIPRELIACLLVFSMLVLLTISSKKLNNLEMLILILGMTISLIRRAQSINIVKSDESKSSDWTN